MPTQSSRPRPSAYLSMSIADFLTQSDVVILGTLTAESAFDIELPQRAAWETSIDVLRLALADVEGHLYLEFDVPRLGSRIDAVVITGSAIFPIEFKAGESSYHRADINQAWDYALDLKNFHRASHDAPIFPILVATDAITGDLAWQVPYHDGVYPPYLCTKSGLTGAIAAGVAAANGLPLDGEAWGRAPYHPTPTIVQAAQALYAQHSVEAISRSDAGARNLAITSKRVEEVIEQARRERQKAIVFVTGVPGAGKTLVGLNIATHRREESSPTHAVFLSGNGPLVAVLREALIRDERDRRRARGERVRKGEIAQKVKPFIQNVHHFRDDGLRDATTPPADRVVIFDEAQRAWNKAQTSKFMQQKKNFADFDQSEPEVLISLMDRHQDWAVIVCLVGNGQEINTGEAGIGAWLDAIDQHFPDWHLFVSPQLAQLEHSTSATLQRLEARDHLYRDPDLHLAVSMRSFRAERVSDFVRAVLDHDLAEARQLLAAVCEQYPIALTRDLAAAKRWVRTHARGNERRGLVASSQALRLKPHAIDVRYKVDPVVWFLSDPTDTRSSDYLEDAATEFQTQGLELDWACVTWDADLRYHPKGWTYHRFRGKKWELAHQDDRRQYMVNAYRVLLTRARQGMVIFVPQGDLSDPTRSPEFYDGTFGYLRDLGMPLVG